jgi:hypothetical protein
MATESCGVSIYLHLKELERHGAQTSQVTMKFSNMFHDWATCIKDAWVSHWKCNMGHQEGHRHGTKCNGKKLKVELTKIVVFQRQRCISSLFSFDPYEIDILKIPLIQKWNAVQSAFRMIKRKKCDSAPYWNDCWTKTAQTGDQRSLNFRRHQAEVCSFPSSAMCWAAWGAEGFRLILPKRGWFA